MVSGDLAAHLLQTPDFLKQGSGYLVSAQGLDLYFPNMPSNPWGLVCQGMLLSDACFTVETGLQVLGCHWHVKCMPKEPWQVGFIFFPCRDAPCFLRQGLQPAAPTDSESAKSALGMAEMPGQDAAGVTSGKALCQPGKWSQSWAGPGAISTAALAPAPPNHRGITKACKNTFTGDEN